MAWDDVSKVAPGVVVWKEPVDKTVAHHQDTVDAVQAAAKKMARDADFVLMAHRYEGHAHIKVEHAPPRLLDSVVWLVSPSNENSGALAAVLSIENGHYTKPRAHGGEGPRTEGEHIKRWVPGIAPLRSALAKSLRERKMSVK